MHQRKWTQRCLDGCITISAFAALSASSLFGFCRAHGAGVVQKKRHRNRSSSRRSLASIPDLEKTMAKHTSLSLRSGTRRLQSTRSRICPIPIQARHSTRGACRHQLGPSGTPDLGSRGEHCRGWLKRCVLLRSTIPVGSLR